MAPDSLWKRLRRLHRGAASGGGPASGGWRGRDAKLREDWGITPRQVFWLLLALLGAISTLGTPASLARLAGQNAYLSALIGLPVGLVPLACWYALDRRLPGLTFTEHARAVLGIPLGTALTLFPVLLACSHLAATIRLATDLVQSSALPRTPAVVVASLLILPTLYGVRAGLEVVARVGEVLAPAGLLAVLLVLIAPVGDMRPSNLLPVLAGGWHPVLQGAIVPVGYYAETFYLTYQLPFRGRSRRAMLHGAVGGLVAASCLLALTTAALTAIFGPLLPHLTVPILGAARVVALGGITTHLDPVLLVAWMAFILVKMEALLYILCISLAQMLQLEDYRPLTLPAAAFCIFAAGAWWGSLAHLDAWLLYAWPFWAAGLALLPCVGVWAVAAIRGVGRRTAGGQPARAGWAAAQHP